jgi:hypothetical protein
LLHPDLDKVDVKLKKKTSSETIFNKKKIKRIRTKSDRSKELKENAIENKTKFEK